MANNHAYDVYSEFLGSLANLEQDSGSVTLSKDDLNEILTHRLHRFKLGLTIKIV
jgi:hypothetical protein